MGRAAAARKLASAAAYGGGGLSVLGASLYGLLRAEAKVARKAIGRLEGRVPDATGWYGRGRPGPAIKVALLGDSSAAGYGVTTVEDTPGAMLGSGIAAQANRRVHLGAFCLSGAKSSDLVGQVGAALPTEPDLAVILIGANDVTHRMLPSESVRFLSEAVRHLQDAGVAVVVGTCPDLGTVRPIPQPLRQVARRWSRRLAAAQTIAVVEAGGRTVSLGSILGPEFDAAPAVLFGPDRFHPSAAGYAWMVGVLLPSALAALGLSPDDQADTRRSEGLRSISKAAVHASKNPGTEVDGTEVAGSARGPGGRWVLQLRRRWLKAENAEAPGSEETEPGAEGSDVEPAGTT
ncbi:SGNH/GDSL hydrolase family protein [Nocardioides marmoriginsengisoli]|uniref:SGNH/GDSL hydrolase family protein n=1 Tax=Nocardioides marmoriginsengisoli TaxID=661483 RepID=A0A3N0CD91_9ACTN|nr:SGNH/GDSL hydrolase family protein [Nocardioides marmoriginsengisoli]RNL61398.1 SGNH/GDSL hydrolase family protein [Nocardioides marmoriginsengisoli]